MWLQVLLLLLRALIEVVEIDVLLDNVIESANSLGFALFI
jgi:hypothetical protein